MRSLRFCSLLFFLSFNFQSWGQLQFRLPDQMLHYRLNLNTAELAKEDFRGNWESKGRLSFEQVIPEDFPFNAVLIAFPYKNNWLLTVMGAQQVYQLDLHKKIFKRLDNSFY